MLMIDVRNAISGILDRYTLADVVEVTLRKIRRNGVEHYFMRAKTGASAGNTPTERRTNTDEGFLAEMMQEK
jgi:hypothetical protein